MSNFIISPHTDDAIFSMGNWIDALGNVTIVSVMAGIPRDIIGKKKHTILRKEHEKACRFYEVKHIEGNFLDDVYPGIKVKKVVEWLKKTIPKDAELYVPLGIHHPDHILVRDIFLKHFRVDFFYEELPYRVLYPGLTVLMRDKFTKGRKLWSAWDTERKHRGVSFYASQTMNKEIFKQLYVEERLWK